MNTWLSTAVVGHLRKTLLRVAQLNGTGGCLDRPMRPLRDCIRRYQRRLRGLRGGRCVRSGAVMFADLLMCFGFVDVNGCFASNRTCCSGK